VAADNGRVGGKVFEGEGGGEVRAEKEWGLERIIRQFPDLRAQRLRRADSSG